MALRVRPISQNAPLARDRVLEAGLLVPEALRVVLTGVEVPATSGASTASRVDAWLAAADALERLWRQARVR